MVRLLGLLCFASLLVATPVAKTASPEGVVQRQIEAFNAHDLEGFLALFAEEVEVSEIPGTSAPTGKARLREVYAERFKANPDLRASARAQLRSGTFVVQKEVIKGRAGKGDPLEVLVIYQVKAGKILKMWGLRE